MKGRLQISPSNSDEKLSIHNRVYYRMGTSAIGVFSQQDMWDRKQKLIQAYKDEEAAAEPSNSQIKNAK